MSAVFLFFILEFSLAQKGHQPTKHSGGHQDTHDNQQNAADDVDYMVLYCLRKCFGFGSKRLKRYYEFFIKANEDLIKHYEIPDAGIFIARKELNQIGCNVEQWNSERSD